MALQLYARQDGTNYSLVLSAPSGAIAGTYSLRIFPDDTTDYLVTETAEIPLVEPLTITGSFTLGTTDTYLVGGNTLNKSITQAEYTSIVTLATRSFTNNSINYNFVESDQITLYNSAIVPRAAVFEGPTYKARLIANGIDISLPANHGFTDGDDVSLIVGEVQLTGLTINVFPFPGFDVSNSPGVNLFGGDGGIIVLTNNQIASISSLFTPFDSTSFAEESLVQLYASDEIPLAHTFVEPVFHSFVESNNGVNRLVVSLPDTATIQPGNVITDLVTDPNNPIQATITFNNVTLTTASLIIGMADNISMADVPGTSFVRLEGINILQTIDAANNAYFPTTNIQSDLPGGNIAYLSLTNSQFQAISNLGVSFTNPFDNIERFYLEDDEFLLYLSNFVPTVERYSFAGNLPSSVSVGDFAWVSEEANGNFNTPIIAGAIETIGTNFITIARNIPGVAVYQSPVVGDMVLHSKNNAVEKSGIIGFFAKVTMTNGSAGEIELFSADTEILALDR